MDDLARNLDALKLAERLHGITEEQLWVHVEAEGPLEKYPAKQHARRVRDRLDVAEGLVYLPGVLAKNNEDSDMPAPFRQRRYFYYLSGCNEAGCHLTYDIKRDLLTLFIPRIDPDRVFWNGRGSTPAEALDKYDIDQILFADQLESWIHEWFSHYRYDGSQRLYVLHREQIPPHSRSPWPVNITSLRPAMDQCRMIKDDHEIKLIRKANDISSEAHRQVLANITKFTNEAQVEGRFLDVCISNQAKQQAYDPIAASGPNAGTLHYGANNEDFGDRQLICLDAGCEFDLYASDITRTFPFSGSWPSKEAENIYKLVEQMQETCIQKLAPGVRYLDLHILAHQIAIDGLLKLGILHNGTREEIYKAGTSRAFFPHGLGHHVGLEVHDVGQRELMSLYKHPKYGKVPSLYPEDFHLPVYDEGLCMAPTLPESPHLDEGMVVTVEPGIYFSAYALNYFYFPSPIHSKYINKEVLARYFPVGGVRIEDDLLITSKGYENLTTAPKGEDMLKIINGQNSRSTPISTQQRADNADESLRRAPGIPKHILDPLLKPIRRASTEPVQPSRPVPDENSAFQNHWFFRESRSPPLSADNNEKRRISKTEKRCVATSENQLSLCGSVSPDFEHMVMGWQNETKQKTHSLYLGIGMKLKPKGRCPQCVVLSETIERLRKTLSRSTETSPKPSPKLDTGNFPLPLVNGQAPSDKKVPEMRQVPTSVPRNSTNDTQSNGSGRGIHAEALRNSHGLPSLSREHDVTRTSWRPTSIHEAVHQAPEQVPLRTHYKVPESIQSGFQRGFGHEPHGQNNINTAYVPQMGTQQGSSTYDGYPNTYSNRLSAGGDEHAIHEPYCPTEVPSRETILNRIERYYRDSATRRSSSLSSGLESKSIPEAGRHNEGSDYRDLTGTLNERQQLRSISFAEPRPSLPNLRNYSTLDMDTRKHVTTSSSQRRSIAAPTASTKQHDLRQRRSVGNSLGSGGVQSQPPMTACTNPVLRNSSKIHNNPWVDGFGTSDPASAYRQERPHRPNDPFPPGAFRGSGHVYAMNRPGGEELGGIDYLNR